MRDGSAGYRGQTDIIAICDFLKMSIAVNVSFLDIRWKERRIDVYGAEYGSVQVTVIYHDAIDGSNHTSVYYYLEHFCFRLLLYIIVSPTIALSFNSHFEPI